MKYLIFLGAVAFATASCGKDVAPSQSNSAATTSPLKAMLDTALVVDVRTPGEFASGHHPRAINIPVDQVESRIAEFGDKKKPVVVYCASGVRSSRAKQTLEAAGYTSVTNGGGFRDLP
jgi:phage shock protein E